jgi:hypothetical protein
LRQAYDYWQDQPGNFLIHPLTHKHKEKKREKVGLWVVWQKKANGRGQKREYGRILYQCPPLSFSLFTLTPPFSAMRKRERDQRKKILKELEGSNIMELRTTLSLSHHHPITIFPSTFLLPLSPPMPRGSKATLKVDPKAQTQVVLWTRVFLIINGNRTFVLQSPGDGPTIRR